MVEVEGIAWSRQMLGEVGPHVRAIAPRVLTTVHDRVVAHHIALDLGTAALYGLMWQAVPRALVQELSGAAGVRPFRPRGAPYEVPVINGVPLVAWRYAKDRATNIDTVPFGHPVSDTRRSVFEVEPDLELDLGFGEAGLGDHVVAGLPAPQQQELSAHLDRIRALAEDGRRIAVLGYASTADGLLRCHLGYADLGADDRLQWAFREELALPSSLAAGTPGSAAPGLRPVSADADDAFDSGEAAPPILRPRRPGESGT